MFAFSAMDQRRESAGRRLLGSCTGQVFFLVSEPPGATRINGDLGRLMAGGVSVRVQHRPRDSVRTRDDLRILVERALGSLEGAWHAGASALLHGSRLHALPGEFSVQESEAQPRVALRAVRRVGGCGPDARVLLWATVYPPLHASARAFREASIHRHGHAPGWQPGVDYRLPEPPGEARRSPRLSWLRPPPDDFFD